jgi:hypothetical protein
MPVSEQSVVRSELRWSAVVGVFIVLILGATLFAALALHRNPPSNLERIDPKTLTSQASSPKAISARTLKMAKWSHAL